MKNCLLSIFIFIAITMSAVSQEPLPKGLTEDEVELYYELINTPFFPKKHTSPEVPPRTPAEWEEAYGVIITWAAYSYELREIVRNASEVANVYILCGNCNAIQNYLIDGNVSLENVNLVQADFNSVWVRDYGPQSVYLEDGSLAFVDWLYNRPRPADNEVPGFMADYLDLDLFQMSGNSGMLTATGGNFMSDGHGTGFSSKLILSENPSYSESQIDQIMYEYMGIDRYIKMNELPYDNISHIDMHMKLIDEETLLVGEFPEGVSDGPFIENNLDYVLSNYNTCFERNYEVVRIPMVPSHSGNYPPATPYRTFANALILNNLVLVPQYGHHLDETGLQVFRDAMPGYNIQGVYMEDVISASGAIHCITREIAAFDPVHISHPRVRIALVDDEKVEFVAEVNSPDGVSSVKLMLATDEDKEFEPVNMTLDNGKYYTSIDGEELELGMVVRYYIKATNNNNKTITKPLVAPEGYYSFEVKLTDDTSVEKYAINPTFKVYPNPANDYINFSASAEFSGGSLTITNIQGQTVYKKRITENAYDILMNIDISNLPAGVYFIRAINDNFAEIKKIIKQ